MSLFMFAAIVGIIAVLVGMRARHPGPAVTALIANTATRRRTPGLFMLRGLSTFVDPASDSVIMYSRRYGETPLTVQTVCWALGLASVFVTCAVYLGWAVFDITTLGNWRFLPPDLPATDRAIEAGSAIVPLLMFVIAAADARALQVRFFAGSPAVFGTIFQLAAGGFIYAHTQVFGNSGLIILSAGVYLLVSHQRQLMVGLLLALVGALMFGLVGTLGPTHVTMLVFILIVAVMTWLSFVGTVEIFSALRWYDPGPAVMVAGLLSSLVLGYLCAFAIPFLMVVVLYVIMMVIPDSLSGPWINMVGTFRTGGMPSAVMLALACLPPLFPALWYLGRGLGILIARNTPMMSRFVMDLSRSEGPLTRSGLRNLLRDHHRASWLGFSLATIACLGLLAGAVLMLGDRFVIES